MNAQPVFIIEIEQEVLGGLMGNANAREAISFLRPYHFLDGFHAALYGAICAAYEQFGTANPVVVKSLIPATAAADLERRTSLDGYPITVSQYLAQLVAQRVTLGQRTVDYAKNIVKQWARVALSAEAERIASLASDAGADAKILAHEASSRFDDIISELRAGDHKRSKVSIGAAVGEAINAAMEAKDTGSGITGITWGLTDVNRMTGGIQRRDLTLIGARPSMGKTTLGLSVGINAAKSGDGVLFFSLEMDAQKLGARSLSDFLYGRRNIEYTRIINGDVTEQEIDAMADAQIAIDRLPLFIDDRTSPTVTDIRVRTERLLEEKLSGGAPISVVFIDHLGLIKASSRYQGNRNNEIGEITAGLKSMARELDVGVVLLSQLNRALENRAQKVPQLSDLRDSGSIEQDADMIAFLYRESYYLDRENGGTIEDQMVREDRLANCRNLMEFHIAKQRNGAVGKIDLFADMGFSAIRNGARQ